MVWIPKEPKYKPKPPTPHNTPTNTPTNIISRQDAIDAICKDWCNTTHKDCKTPFNQEIDEYYHCDGCGDVETLLALPPADRSTGEWIQNDNGTYSCSVCHSWIPEEQHHYARFCLYCGVDMRGDTE